MRKEQSRVRGFESMEQMTGFKQGVERRCNEELAFEQRLQEIKELAMCISWGTAFQVERDSLCKNPQTAPDLFKKIQGGQCGQNRESEGKLAGGGVRNDKTSDCVGPFRVLGRGETTQGCCLKKKTVGCVSGSLLWPQSG